MFPVILALGVARAACPEPASNAELLGVLRSEEAAYAARDIAGFTTLATRARGMLPCLDEPISPTVAAAWHRASALQATVAITAESRPTSVASFRAMLASESNYALAPGLAGPGSVVPAWLDEARGAGPGPTEPAAAPDHTHLLFDGVVGADRPTQRPTILQLEWEDPARVRYTAELGPGDALPDWAALGLLPSNEVIEPSRWRLSRRGTLLTGGGALALSAAAGLALGLAEANRSDFLNASTPEEASADISRSHALSALGGLSVAGVAGVGVLLVLHGQL